MHSSLPGLVLPIFPNHWQEELEWVQQKAPLAVVAGGAVRDLILGHPVKDLDIVLPFFNGSNVWETIQPLFAEAEAAGEVVHSLSRETADSYAARFPELLQVHELRGPNQEAGAVPPIQLISVELPEHVAAVRHLPGTPEEVDARVRSAVQWWLAARADFGICRAAWNGREYLLTNEFLRDNLRRTWTLLRAESTLQDSLRRFEEFHERGMTVGWRVAVDPSVAVDLHRNVVSAQNQKTGSTRRVKDPQLELSHWQKACDLLEAQLRGVVEADTNSTRGNAV